MARGINRYAPSLTTSGVVICDTDLSGGNGNDKPIGPSTYGFLPAGWVGGANGVPIMQTPNIALSQTVNANASFVFNSTSLVNIGSVFPGQPVQIQVQGIAAVAGAVVTLVGFNGKTAVTDTLTFNNLAAAGLATQISANSYTSLTSAVVTTQNLTNATISTVYLKTNSGQPFLAAALDLNSTAGAFLNPKMFSSDIENLDTITTAGQSQGSLANVQNNVPVSYATTDGMQVYNKTTGAISIKRNGAWDNFYLEDLLRTNYRRSYTVLNRSKIQGMGANGGLIQVTPAPPVYPVNPTYFKPATAVAIATTTLLSNAVMPYPASIILINTSSTSNITYTITGTYNGATVTETITVTTTAGTITTTSEYSFITSIVAAVTTAPDTISVGIAASSAIVMPYRLSLQLFNKTTAFATGGALGLSYTNAIAGIAGFTTVNAGFMTNAANNSTVVPITTVSTPTPNLPLFFGNATAAFTGGLSSAQLIVGLEYEIIW
jgi:hypothetical protein